MRLDWFQRNLVFAIGAAAALFAYFSFLPLHAVTGRSHGLAAFFVLPRLLFDDRYHQRVGFAFAGLAAMMFVWYGATGRKKAKPRTYWDDL